MFSMQRFGAMMILLLAAWGCGSEQPQLTFHGVVGGSRITDTADPSMKSTVALFSRGDIVCTGTLIGMQHVVTAAHCLGGNGQSGLESVGFGANGRMFTSSIIAQAINPFYQGMNGPMDLGSAADIALLIFADSINSYIEPVEIAPVPMSGPVLVAGYGVTAETRNDSGTLRKVNTRINYVVNQEFALAPDGRGACYGDSGGPAYRVNNGKLQLIGATSRAGRSQSCNGGDGIFTSVFPFKSWLQNKAAALGYPMNP